MFETFQKALEILYYFDNSLAHSAIDCFECLNAQKDAYISTGSCIQTSQAFKPQILLVKGQNIRV